MLRTWEALGRLAESGGGVVGRVGKRNWGPERGG